jgi:uncharacterized RDD family membrane protein YckC
MSDVSQGPDWWLASDGKWYPPEQHPGNAPPPGPPPSSGPPPTYGAYVPPAGSAPPYGQPSVGAPFGYAPGPVDSQGRPLAEWWQRLVAILIDGIIIGIAYSVLIGIVVRHSISHGFTHFGLAAWIVDLIVGIGGIAYFSLLEGNERGQSLGQMALGIAVRDAATGGPIDPRRAGIRMVILYPWLVLIWIPVIGPLLAFVGDLWGIMCGLSPLWNPNRQGYHDLAQRTTVVKVR